LRSKSNNSPLIFTDATDLESSYTRYAATILLSNLAEVFSFELFEGENSFRTDGDCSGL